MMERHCPINRKALLLLALCLALAFPLCANDFLFTSIDASQGLSDNRIRYILQLPDGRMVFTTSRDVNLYDGARFTSLQRPSQEAYTLKRYKGFCHVYLSGDSLLWIKDYRQVACLDLHSERYIPDLDSVFQKKGVRHPVEDLFVDPQGLVWLIVSGELVQPELSFRLKLPEDRGTIQDLTAEDDCLYLFYDTGEIVCYEVKTGAERYAVAAYPGEEQEKFRRTSLIIRGRNGFYQLRNGSKGGFFYFDLHRRQWKKIMETDYTLNTLMISPDEKAYISCVRGFWIIDPESRTQHYLPALRTQKGNVIATEISTIFQDRQGAIWLGTFNRGLLYYHPARYQRIHIDKTDFPITPGERSADANFAEDRDGNIFVKDRAAVYRLDLRKDRNRILVPVEPSALPKELQGEYGSGAAFVAHDGTLYFADADGCDVFRPNSRPPSSTLPYPPVFTAFYVHGERIVPHRSYEGRTILSEAAPYAKEIALNHDQNFLTFEFSALNYFSREHTYYRYRLEGIDAQWVSAGNVRQNNGILQAPYTNLPPGNYTFRVMASADADRWDEGQATQIRLTIHAPWWKTGTAYLIYILLSLAMIVAGIRLSIYRAKKKMERKHKEEILLLRIRNLIEQCDRYEAEQKNRPEQQNRQEDAPTSEEKDTAESAFLTKAIELVEKNLHVPGYSVEQLSRDLCMERTGLYRKLVALLDQSPSLFIRNIRLQRAAQLIREGNLSITEIAERTGFSSPSYLSKCFQEMYGCRPSEYADKMKKST